MKDNRIESISKWYDTDGNLTRINVEYMSGFERFYKEEGKLPKTAVELIENGTKRVYNHESGTRCEVYEPKFPEVFKRLYKAVKDCEDEFGCPLVICGVMFNTSGNQLDFEWFGGCGFISDDYDFYHAGIFKRVYRNLRNARNFFEEYPFTIAQ